MAQQAGLVTLIVGASMADSENLMIPFLLVAIGALLMMMGKDD